MAKGRIIGGPQTLEALGIVFRIGDAQFGRISAPDRGSIAAARDAEDRPDVHAALPVLGPAPALVPGTVRPPSARAHHGNPCAHARRRGGPARRAPPGTG